ncbi:MAG: hypothetical protein M1827_002223 [Pycnora praestabilis]|nr:MAG: hypothetical protein M1827_002223 [Pycnora praestabilis]
MSTSTPTSSGLTAPWKSAFLEHLNKMPSPEFVFSSLHTAPAGSPTPYIPSARYCIFRGFWAELPENKHNEAPMNPRVYESEMPTFTSDVRMQKVPEIFKSSAGHAKNDSQAQGSGGGGPVEAVWWIKEVGTQWRMRGEAFVIGQDIEGGRGDVHGEVSSGVRTVKSEVGSRMRMVDEEKGEAGEWSWGKELTAHFGNNSPGLRGTFRNPPPGTPVPSSGQPPSDHAPGQKVTDLHDPIARANFRVVVIKPSVVEQLDISDPVKARRYRYTYVGESGEHDGEKEKIEGEWLREELWP